MSDETLLKITEGELKSLLDDQIEECAKRVEALKGAATTVGGAHANNAYHNAAAAIRALKEKP